MPKKKKKGAEKEKKVKKSRHMNEKDTLTYEQEILDNNRQIARLRSRNQELEAELETIKTKLQKLEEDRSDVIAHLKRNLQHKIAESQELNDRLYALEEQRNEEMIAFRKKEEELDDEYRTMETNLTAEIALAAGKLSALEEWRNARNDLVEKFEIQEKQIAEQEERHKQQLYEVERNLIMSKAKLQKEMEERLNQLGQNFRDTTNLRIADTTKQAIYENIAMNRELDVMFKMCRHFNAKMSEYKQRDYNLKIQASLYQAETESALKKVIKQNKIIKKLAYDHLRMKGLQRELNGFEKDVKLNESLAREYEQKCHALQKRIQELERYLEEVHEIKKQILEEIEVNRRDMKKLKEVLRKAKECIVKMLQLYPKADPENIEAEECWVKMSQLHPESEENVEIKSSFLRTMLDILGSDLQIQTPFHMPKLEEFNKYIQGDLGLVGTLDQIETTQESTVTQSEQTGKDECVCKGADKEELILFESDCSDTSTDVSSSVEEPQHTEEYQCLRLGGDNEKYFIILDSARSERMRETKDLGKIEQ